MKHLHKYLPLLLVLLLVLGLAGCGAGGGEEPSAAAEAPAAEESADTGDAEAADEAAGADTEETADSENIGSVGDAANAEAAEPEVEYEHGTIDDHVYTNDFFGFTFTVGDSWSFSDEDELNKINKNIDDIVDNEAVTEALKSGITLIDMQAADSSNPLSNVNLTVAYAPGFTGADYINDTTIKSMTKMYEDAGFEDVSIDKTTANVSGEKVDALLTTMTVQGNSIVEKQVFFTSNGYLGTFTVAGFEESDCDLLLNQLSK